MNRYLLYIMVAVAGLAACNQPPKPQEAKDANAKEPSDAAEPIPYFYMQLKGSIGDMPVTMQLLKTNPDVYRGYYCYDRVGELISIWGTLDSSQQLTLYEEATEQQEAFFRGSLDDKGNFKGTWRGAGTSHPFSLKKNLDKAVQFDVYYARDSALLLPDLPHSPVGTASSSILWPVEDTDDKIASFIKTVISGGKPGSTPRQLLKKDIDSFLVLYKGSAVDMDTAAVKKEGGSPVWDWSLENGIDVVWNQYPLLVLQSGTETYTGGAHGSGGSSYDVLDLDKRKVLTVDDVFKGEYKTVLTRELGLAFHKKYKVSEDEPVKGILFVDDIEPNENFILTNKGVMFSYMPYEIGPYAMGQINLFVPYDRIKEVLKEDYSK